MNTETIEEHRADGSVCITSKEYRDALRRLVTDYSGGSNAFAEMIKRDFQKFPIPDPFVIEKP